LNKEGLPLVSLCLKIIIVQQKSLYVESVESAGRNFIRNLEKKKRRKFIFWNLALFRLFSILEIFQ
jgi:hypothetical protein